MRRLFWLFILGFIVACKPCECITTTVLPEPSVNVRDSIVVHIHDSIVYIPTETSSNATFEQLSHVETSMAYSDANVDSMGILHHTITNKSGIKEKVRVETITITKDSIIDRPYPIYVDKEVPAELSRMQEIEIQVGKYALFALCAIIAYYLVVLYRKGIFGVIVGFIRGLFKK